MTAVIEALIDAIRTASKFNSNIQVAPAAVLWPDKERQWQAAMGKIQTLMPEVLVLGDYQPEAQQGPAIWLKCKVANTLPDDDWPDGLTPIIYLPGVSRSDLRAIESCPKQLQPIAELQYRGALWSQYNGKDWTVNAFLSSTSGGLGLDVSRDNATQKALLGALNQVLESSVEDLAGKHLEATDFNQLLAADPVRDLLIWMNDTKRAEQEWEGARWKAFINLCKSDFHFDPMREGDLVAAERLCAHEGVWQKVWRRYEQSYQFYPGLPTLLERVASPQDLFAETSKYPAANKQAENELYAALDKLVSANPSAARKQILVLEKEHQQRRSSLWSKQGNAPLAMLLQPLAIVAEHTQNLFGGLTPTEMAEHYMLKYWQVDDAALRALDLVKATKYKSLVTGLLKVMYSTWLAETTKTFQQLVKQKGYPGTDQMNEATAHYQPGGEVIIFVDGLRFDVAQRLTNQLNDLGAEVVLNHNWAALPSVTATAKAAVTPTHDAVTGRLSDKDFQPSLVAEEKPYSSYYFRKEMTDAGWQILPESELGAPTGNAWVECGDIDKEGHVKGLKLAGRIDALLEEIIERIQELLQAGWQKVRIVTDHGWLLIPGGLPKFHLPKHATETRWGRCAALKEGVGVDEMTLGWHWNAQVSIAYAPGTASFIAGKEYDHGGISLQECLTPVITVKRTGATQAPVAATIESIEWRGLTCKVQAATKADGVQADLRQKPADPGTSMAKAKVLKNGKCSLMIDDDANEGVSAIVVLMDKEGNLLAKKSTIVGGED